MIGDRFVGIHRIDRPIESLRYAVSMMCEPISLTSDYSMTASSTTIFTQHIIFRLHRRLDYNKYEYQYMHNETNEKFAVQIRENIELLMEPTEIINLDKLKSKFRSKEKMTKLLLRYYRN